MSKELLLAIFGAGLAFVSAIIGYWLKDSWEARKKAQESTSQSLDNFEKEVFAELKRISEKIDEQRLEATHRMHTIDKEISTKVSSIVTSIETLSLSAVQYQKELAKLEGQLQGIIKAQAEYMADAKVNNAKFERIFNYIDNNHDGYKNLSKGA